MVIDVGRWKLEGYCGHLGIMQNYSIAFKVSESQEKLEIIYYIAAMKKKQTFPMKVTRIRTS